MGARAQPFLLNMAQAYYHPQYSDFLLQLLGNAVFVNNVPPTGENESFWIRDLPVGQWFTPRDRHGREIPLALFVSETGELYGAWR
jgi:hypothetical protein